MATDLPHLHRHREERVSTLADDLIAVFCDYGITRPILGVWADAINIEVTVYDPDLGEPNDDGIPTRVVTLSLRAPKEDR